MNKLGKPGIEIYSNKHKSDRNGLQVARDVFLCLKDIRYGEAVFLGCFMLNMMWFVPAIGFIIGSEKLFTKLIKKKGKKKK